MLTANGIDSFERKDVLAFLSQASGEKVEYAPASGEIVGILKQMKDDMNKDLGGIVEVEEAAQKSYDELVAAKTDLEDSTAELSDSEKYMANLSVMCEEKTKEWE